MAKRSQTAQIEEVKTLLHQLQRIRFEPANPDPQDGREGDSGQAPVRPRTRSAKPFLVGGVALVLISAAIAGASLLRDKPGRQNRDSATAAVQQPASLAPPSPGGAMTAQLPEMGAALSLLQQAQQIMVSGDILRARQILVSAADAGPPDVALALARSYDPNFLQSVTNPNAAADIEQATLWYRRWHQAAVEKGLVTDTQRLDRILRSMR